MPSRCFIFGFPGETLERRVRESRDVAGNFLERLRRELEFRPQPLENFAAMRVNHDLAHDALHAQAGSPIAGGTADNVAYQDADGIVPGTHDLIHHAVKSG